jgi:O-antigen/teichoic acid export membrane protein
MRFKKLKILNKERVSKLVQKKPIRDFFAVGLVDIALKPIQFVKGFIIARYLGPADFGLLRSIELISMLNKYGNLGFKSTARREVSNFLGAGNVSSAAISRDTAYAAEFILSLLLFSAGISLCLFVKSSRISILLILASSHLLFSKIDGILSTEATIQKKFILISKITFLTTTVSNIVIIVLVPFLKIYAIMITNCLLSVFAIVIYQYCLRLRLPVNFNIRELKRQFKIGIPLTIATLAYGTFQYCERISIIKIFGKTSLGMYSFADMITGQLSIFLKN